MSSDSSHTHSIDCFDFKYYLLHNLDISRVFKDDYAAIFNHFQVYGRFESRRSRFLCLEEQLAGKLPISGGILTGSLDLNGNDLGNIGSLDGILTADIVTLQVLEGLLSTMLSTSGGTIRGDLNMSGRNLNNVGSLNSIPVNDIVTLSSLETLLSTLLSTSGGTMTGDLNMSNRNLNNVGLLNGIPVDDIATNASLSGKLDTSGGLLSGNLDMSGNRLDNVSAINGQPISSIVTENQLTSRLSTNGGMLLGSLNMMNNNIDEVGTLSANAININSINGVPTNMLTTTDQLAMKLDVIGGNLTNDFSLNGYGLTNVSSLNRVPLTDLVTTSQLTEITNQLNQLSTLLSTTGGTLTGNLNLGGNSISNVDQLSTARLMASGLNYPASDGMNGQVMTTDGSGNISFTNLPFVSVVGQAGFNGLSYTSRLCLSEAIVSQSQNVNGSATGMSLINTGLRSMTSGLYMIHGGVTFTTTAVSKPVSLKISVGGTPTSFGSSTHVSRDRRYVMSVSAPLRVGENQNIELVMTSDRCQSLSIVNWQISAFKMSD